MPDQRGQLLRAALGFAGLPRPSYDCALWGLRVWLDSWAGIGRVAVGMARQGFDLQLTRYDDRAGELPSSQPEWNTVRRARRAPRGSGTPWRATQRAAWEALKKTD
jgi:hypothetical protein